MCLKGDVKRLLSIAVLGYVPTYACLLFVMVRFAVLLYLQVRRKWFPDGSTNGFIEVRVSVEINISEKKNTHSHKRLTLQVSEARILEPCHALTDLRWPEPIYMRVGYVFELRFSAETI